MNGRTPGPWRVEPEHEQDDVVVRGTTGHGETIFRIYANPRNIANAAFIVRACNAHDELVAALQGVMGLVQLLSARSELQPDRKAILSNHRFLEAERVLAKVQPSNSKE